MTTQTTDQAKQTSTNSTVAKQKQPTLKEQFKVGDLVKAQRNKRGGTVTEVKAREIKIIWDGDTQPRGYKEADLVTVMIEKIEPPEPNAENEDLESSSLEDIEVDTTIPTYDYSQFSSEVAEIAAQTTVHQREIIKIDFENRLKQGEMLVKVAVGLEAQHGAIKGKKIFVEWLKSEQFGKLGKVEAMRNKNLYEWFHELSEKVKQLVMAKVWQLGIDGCLALAKLPEHLQNLLGYLLQLKNITKSEIKKAAAAFAPNGKVKIISGEYKDQIATVQTQPEGKHGGFNAVLESGETCRLIVADCFPFEAAPKPEKASSKKENEAVQAMQTELNAAHEKISQLEKEVEESRVIKAQLAEQTKVTNTVVSILGKLAQNLGWEVNQTGDLLAELEAFASGLGQAKTPQPAPELLAA